MGKNASIKFGKNGKILEMSFYNNSKLFWNKVKGAHYDQHVLLKNEEGVLTDKDEKVGGWYAEYFKHLYNESYIEENVQNAVEDVIHED